MTKTAHHASDLRSQSEGLAAGFPALLARAQQMAATMSMGAHGRRRAGLGEEFWQYRPAMDGDPQTAIDWRRSAQSDQQFVRQMEWQSAQSVNFWIDPGAAMNFTSQEGRETKAQRAQSLGLALAILLSKGGERVGLMQDPEPPKQGEVQIGRMALSLALATDAPDYAIPPNKQLPTGSQAVFLSDFLGDWDAMVAALSKAADQNVAGCLVQILDPQELSFPFKGRTIFESMQGSLTFETMRATALRDDYLDRLARRSDSLQALARDTGWQYYRHVTDTPAQSALVWLYGALDAGARG